MFYYFPFPLWYGIVSDAFRFAARRARSGMLYDDLHTQTMRFMYRLIRDRTRLLTRAAAPGADAVMAMLMPHHVGHSVGVNVHDATPGAWRLAENHVFTIEPGLYFDPDLVHRTRGLCAATLRECAPMGGIRIEDTFVMRDGVVRSLVGLPVAADDIERALRERHDAAGAQAWETEGLNERSISGAGRT